MESYQALIAGKFGGRQAAFAKLLESVSFKTLTAQSGSEATRIAEKSEPGIILLDYDIGGAGVYDCLASIKKSNPNTPTIIISRSSQVQSPLDAIKQGAFWLLKEPFDLEQLLFIVNKACITYEVSRVDSILHRTLEQTVPGDFICNSPRSLKLIELVKKIALLDSTVLITGESGTGKTALAYEIHKRGPRSSSPFVPVSCASIPRDLLEAELFGHEKGAFTGAVSSRMGSVELAHGGTLFLDEIGDMPLDLQPKLLTFLQDRTVKRIGATKGRMVDARIIAATNKNMAGLCADRLFREDLFYRLNVLSFEAIPLRNRVEDIRGITFQYLESLARRRGMPHFQVSSDALAALEAYSWPGNVRELQNILERATAYASHDLITLNDLALPKGSQQLTERSTRQASLYGLTLKELERTALVDTLNALAGDKEKAARALGVSLKTLYNMINRYGLKDLEVLKR